MSRLPGLLANIKETYEVHNRSLLHMGFWAVCNYHFGRWALASPSLWIRKLGGWAYGLMGFLVDINSGIQLNREADIGEKLHLVHGWNIKVHPATVIGNRVGIMHDVTFGTSPDTAGAPTIGDDVFIGAGAKLLGPIKIGNGARIAANSLVIFDVPAGQTAIGVPARVMRYTGRPEAGSSEEAQKTNPAT